MPSASLQSRINVFEAPTDHSQAKTALSKTTASFSAQKASPQRSNLLDSGSPLSPSSAGLASIPSLTPSRASTPSPRDSPDALRSSQWTTVNGSSSSLRSHAPPPPPPPVAIPVPQPKAAPPLPRKPVPTLSTTYATYVPKHPTGSGSGAGSPASLISLDSPSPTTSIPRTPSAAPPLPPRKASLPVSPNSPRRTPMPLRTPSLQSMSDTLSAHGYPPSSPSPSTRKLKHSHSTSTSSFQSVSLGEDGDDTVTASFDIIDSSPGSSSSISTGASGSRGEDDKTPVLVQRAWATPTPSPAPALPPKIPLRKPTPALPPRPPPSTTTTASLSPPRSHSHPSLARRTPIPPAFQKRYDALFERNLPPSTSAGASLSPPPEPAKPRRTGWRGLSVDGLPTAPPAPPTTTPPDRLPGHVVKAIWTCSKLPLQRLQEIWNECDADKAGALDREAFGRGMWRIDEELRRAGEEVGRRGRGGGRGR